MNARIRSVTLFVVDDAAHAADELASASLNAWRAACEAAAALTRGHVDIAQEAYERADAAMTAAWDARENLRAAMQEMLLDPKSKRRR